jgi:hypothetical protein
MVRPLSVKAPRIAMSQAIDRDLAALQTTIDSLVEGRDGDLPADGAGLTIEKIGETALELSARAERLLERESRPVRRELEQLHMETCAEGYRLEAERLRTKRRMLVRLADTSGGSQDQVRELSTLYRSMIDELERMEAVIAGVRARLEKARASCMSFGDSVEPARQPEPLERG